MVKHHNLICKLWEKKFVIKWISSLWMRLGLWKHNLNEVVHILFSLDCVCGELIQNIFHLINKSLLIEFVSFYFVEKYIP